MKKPLRTQAVEYLQYLKEQGITHVPSSGKKIVKPPTRSTPVTPSASAPAKAAPTPAPAPAPKKHLGPESLESIAAEIAACHLCPLASGRKNTVPGQGPLRPDIMFIGEGPGADEDEQGLPFVGRSGQLLTDMIRAMGYAREQVYIGNIVKCRPPENRTPTPIEMEGCIHYLKRQIALIQPKLIVCLGATASRGLVNEALPIGKARGNWREFEGIPVMLTFHPAYLLRDPRQKAPCWSDLKAVLARLGK